MTHTTGQQRNRMVQFWSWQARQEVNGKCPENKFRTSTSWNAMERNGMEYHQIKRTRNGMCQSIRSQDITHSAPLIKSHSMSRARDYNAPAAAHNICGLLWHFCGFPSLQHRITLPSLSDGYIHFQDHHRHHHPLQKWNCKKFIQFSLSFPEIHSE